MIAYSHLVVEARPHRGEDRVAVLQLTGRTLAIVADGAGGVTGGADAASFLCSALTRIPSWGTWGMRDWCGWLALCDRKMMGGGLAAGVVLSVADDGSVSGASVGDCEAWDYRHGALELTSRQARKPLLGSGAAVPMGFTTHLSGGALVVATDGLWKYATPATVRDLASVRPLGAAVHDIVESVRLRSGALHDDVAVLMLEAS